MKRVLSLFLTVIMIFSVFTIINVNSAEIENYNYEVKKDGTIKITKYNGTDKVVDIPATINGKKVTVIGERAFEDNKTLDKITFPNTLKKIGEHAFSGCINLEDFTFPDSVVEIDNWAFSGCDIITEITLGKNVQKMGYGVFSSCDSLSKVTLNNKITYIAKATFSHCESLEEIEIPQNITAVEDEAFFYCTSLRTLPIGENVKTIGDSAYGYCTYIRNVEIPEKVEIIGRWSFYKCVRMKKLTIPKSVKKIYNNAFEECRQLKTVYFNAKKCDLLCKRWFDKPDRKAKNYVFYRCRDLEKIIIGDTVEKFPVDIFRDVITTNLKEIKICNDLKDISYKSIDNSKTAKVQKVNFNNVVKGHSNGDISILNYGKANVRFDFHSSKRIIIFNVVPRRVKTKNIKITTSGKTAVVKLNDTRNLKFIGKVSTDESFENSTTLTCKNRSFKIKNLKKGKTYYFRVRAYKTVNGTKIKGNSKTVSFVCK